MRSAHALSVLGAIGVEGRENDALARAARAVQEMLEQQYTESPEDEGVLMTTKIDELLDLDGPKVAGRVEEVDVTGGMPTAPALLALTTAAQVEYPDSVVVQEAAEVGRRILGDECEGLAHGKSLTNNIDVWMRG